MAIQNVYTPQKVERILGRPPVPQFKDKTFEPYDAVIKEGVRSKSQRDAYYYELVNLKRDQIVDVPQSEIVRALQMTGVDDLREAIEQQEQIAQQQQAKIDEQERVGLELANTQIQANLATASERKSRERSNLGLEIERISEAEQNRADAALQRAKTISEIADMETDRLMRVMEFVRQMEEAEIADRKAIGEELEAKAQAITESIERPMVTERLDQATPEMPLTGMPSQEPSL